MPSRRTLLLASAAALAEAIGAADVASLVQRETRLHAAGASGTDDACKCIAWTDAYSRGKGMCGLGHELDMEMLESGLIRPWEAVDPGQQTKAAIKIREENPTMNFEYCKMFFSQLPSENFCLNSVFGSKPTEWCYVSEDCADGVPAGFTDLRSKKCSRDQDTALSQMKFEDFAPWVYRNKLELGLSSKFAYPTWANETWADVQTFWGFEADPKAAPMSEDLRRRLQALVDSGRTVRFESRDRHPPFAVAEGTKLYYINFGPDKANFAKKEDINIWGCIAGCGDKTIKRWEGAYR